MRGCACGASNCSAQMISILLPCPRFGFNNGQGAVDGLWAGGTDAATDFLESVRQLQLLGFNAVRLPYR